MTTTAKTPAAVAFVGSGPGDPGLLTVRAAGLLRRFDHPLASHALAFALTVALTVIGWRLVQVVKHVTGRSHHPRNPPD